MTSTIERIKSVLGQMDQIGPKQLKKYLACPNPEFDVLEAVQVDELVNQLLSDTESAEAVKFADLLRGWDNSKDAEWIKSTIRNTAARRKRIHECLASDPELSNRIDKVIPFFILEEPLIIAKEHKDWYHPEGNAGYYWPAYKSYLRSNKGWVEESILNLDNATRAVIECLANPTSPEAYSSRGLVIGYVQSGKTANFTGVVARAADAGYRLIIILAGTWNILRDQTQRRVDKELLGHELLANDEVYRANPPKDWDEFMKHGFNPMDMGYFNWERITTTMGDFKGLKAAIEALEFQRHERTVPLYGKENLDRLPVKLLIIKKNSTVLKKLNKDLKRLRVQLNELPALIIDDESDQAGINTIAPKPLSANEAVERSTTNKCIVELLGLLPRGQYVGYTATPYANALVDPDDGEDLFPKDFIISLDRAEGYMGISDFFDPDSVYKDLDKNNFKEKEIAFIRRVENAQDADDEDLKSALRSFVISGGIKLFREAVDPKKFRFRHHTMLVHISVKKDDMARIAARIHELWDDCAFNSPSGVAALKEFFEKDFRRVSSAQEPRLPFPESIEELAPFLISAIAKIKRHQSLTMVLNSDSKDAPDFGENPVWRILVGGNKLSRGYTVEGLTISYYRRLAGAADTLMQMGRWFGYRLGYKDLVRVFLGVREGRTGTSDLVELFKSACLMEERFRDEVKRYLRKPDAARITPRDVPPLIQITGQIRPTARNKMFNAKIHNRNYGGRWSQPTLVTADTKGREANHAALSSLLAGGSILGKDLELSGVTSAGSNDKMRVHLFETGTSKVIGFLEDFHWVDDEYPWPKRPRDITLQIEFLRNEKHGITSYLVLLPQLKKESFGPVLELPGGLPPLKVKERQRIEGRAYQQFGEPAHRRMSMWMAELNREGTAAHLFSSNDQATSLRNKHRGILVVYPVRESAGDLPKKGPADIGYEILYPANKLGYDINFTVRRSGDSEAVVVPAGQDDTDV